MGELPTSIAGYTFKDPLLLHRALRHSSLNIRKHDQVGDNQLLEFLGDRVLSLVIVDALLDLYPQQSEGQLAYFLNALVNGSMLTKIALAMGLDSMVMTIPSLRGADGRVVQPRILEDACEAVFGALYHDAGFSKTKAIILHFWDEPLRRVSGTAFSPKSFLQEWAQKNKRVLPFYHVVQQEGSAHALIFHVSLVVADYPPVIATGSTKREAEANAATLFLERHHIRPSSSDSPL